MASPPASALPRIGWRGWITILAAYLGLYAAWLALNSDDDFWRLFIGNTAPIPMGLLAAAAALSVGQMPARTGLSRRRQFRQGWTFLGLGILVWAAGDAVWAYYELVLHIEAPLISLADPVYLAGYVLAAIAVLLSPRKPRPRYGQMHIYLDILITASGITVLGLLAFIWPLLQTSESGTVEAAWSALYPAADLALLLLLITVFIISEPNDLRSGFGFVFAGLFAFLVTDLSYGFLIARGQYETGRLIDLGWPLGDALMALGAFYHWHHQPAAPPSNDGDPRPRLGRRVQGLLPWATVITLALYTLIDWRMTGRINHLAEETAIILGVALVARQGVVAGEAELRHYAHLVNSAADPAFICDGQRRLKLVNPALLTALGYSHDEQLLGQSALTLFAPADDAPGSGLTPAGLFETGFTTGCSGEVLMQRRDGSRFPAYLSLRPLYDETGARREAVGTAHDLTEQKRQQAVLHAAYEAAARAQRALAALNVELEQKVEEKTRSLVEAYARLEEQNHQLQTLDTLKSDFVALVSHELRAPLTNVVGGIELLLARASTLAPEARETLAVVQAQIRRLTQFVESILDVSALDAGRLPFTLAPLHLGYLEQAVRGTLWGEPAAKRLRFELPDDLPLVLADERALTSLAFHLVDNALKYAPQGEVLIHASAAEDRVYLSVSDQGPGIPRELRELAFDKFQRLDASDARTVYGHGLGLYLSRRLVEAMHGGICADEAPGGGARFTLWLPALEEADE